MIIRRRRVDRFTIIDNQIVDDERLSFEAVGLLTYLLSRPDDWQVHVNQLASRGGCGRDKMRRVLRELIEAGYIVHRRVRDQVGGQFIAGEYEVRDLPADSIAAPRTENPSVATDGFSGAGKPVRVLNNERDQESPPYPPASGGNGDDDLEIGVDTDPVAECKSKAEGHGGNDVSIESAPRTDEDTRKDVAGPPFSRFRTAWGEDPRADWGRARKAWGRLSVAERQRAVAGAATFRMGQRSRREKVVASATFLRSRLDSIGDDATVKRELVEIPTFGKEWFALFWMGLSDPSRLPMREDTDGRFAPVRMVSASRTTWGAKSTVIPAALVPDEAPMHRLVPVQAGGPGWAEWHAYLLVADCKLRLPEFDRERWLFVPAVKPPVDLHSNASSERLKAVATAR